MSIIVPFVTWYIVIQLVGVAALPLTLRFFGDLPDRGYSFAKILGVFLTGLILWLGTSYGFLRNEAGGAWLALGIVAGVSYGFGSSQVVGDWLHSQSAPAARTHRRHILGVETLFLVAFAVWTWVRANDPAANHTEQPMDLMFMNSIWASATFPPHDAWLSGYAISYYYFGYWLLTTLGRLSNIPPAIAYTVGQASWYGLLLVGAFGVAYNLAALHSADYEPESTASERRKRRGRAHAATGLVASLFVGVIGNLQVIPEWLYANGANLDRLAAWLDVNGFPANAQRSGLWHIGYDWWWWRSSRVISDRDLTGGHIEVIDEFPAFSYILGDNHPHVLAMPFVLLVIAMALAVFLSSSRTGLGDPEGMDFPQGARILWARLRASLPMGLPGLVLIVAVSGGLVFLNTWDYPPYLLLLVLAMLFGLVTSEARFPTGRTLSGRARLVMPVAVAVLFGAALAVGTLVVYLPYFLTAQSQAGGIFPNLFNPTRLQQAFLMFGVFLPALLGWLLWMWRVYSPAPTHSAATAGVVYGVPVAFLVLASVLAVGTPAGRTLLQQVELPAETSGLPSSHAGFILARWTRQPLTLLVFGGLLSAAAALVLRLADASSAKHGRHSTLFVLLLAMVGLALAYVPEFLFLRDNFGTRMNTVFKFYYQAWLLLALVAAYGVGTGLFAAGPRGLPSEPKRSAPKWARLLFALTLVLGALALLYPIAGAYSKTLGFCASSRCGAHPRTLDSTEYVARDGSPLGAAEKAAADWVLYNTTPDALVLEGKGASYQSAYNRISVFTGRPTLLGWDGHESQWRGEAFGDMARGRAEALEIVYRTGSPSEIEQALALWGIDYVYIGPMERQQYGLTLRSEERIAAAMDLVFEDGDVRVYKRRGS